MAWYEQNADSCGCGSGSPGVSVTVAVNSPVAPGPALTAVTAPVAAVPATVLATPAAFVEAGEVTAKEGTACEL